MKKTAKIFGVIAAIGFFIFSSERTEELAQVQNMDRVTYRVNEKAEEPMTAYATEPSTPDTQFDTNALYLSDDEIDLSDDEIDLSDDEIDLIALVTMAEAEGEPEEGQRLVIDAILNRVESEHFPDTVTDVVYQPNQFAPMQNGRIERCYVRDDIRALVIEELKSRTNTDVVFFTAGSYGSYGTPLFQVGNHYFASY